MPENCQSSKLRSWKVFQGDNCTGDVFVAKIEIRIFSFDSKQKNGTYILSFETTC